MQPSASAKLFLGIAGFLGLAAVMFGVSIVRSPGEMRLVKFDNRRVHDLKELKKEIGLYFNETKVLPSTLGELREGRSGIKVPLDPVQQTPYSYLIKGEATFDLCAIFATSNLDRRHPDFDYTVGRNVDWRHGKGEVCFSISFDSDDEAS